MLVRGLVRLLSVVGPLVILVVLAARYYNDSTKPWSLGNGAWSSAFPSGWKYTTPPKDDGLKVAPNIYDLELAAQDGKSASETLTTTPDDLPVAPDIYDLEEAAHRAKETPPAVTPAWESPPDQTLSKTPVATSDEKSMAETHNELFSASTPDRKYFPLVFGEHEALNPNIIPYPTANDTWLMVAQKRRHEEGFSARHIELVCDAQFQADGSLACVQEPGALPIAATTNGAVECQGKWDLLKYNNGPHDGRVFYGPDAPYTVYGSNSQYTCFGQWMQDMRLLVDWPVDDEEVTFERPAALEIHRPEPFGHIEKNWFVFWDADNATYVHYDISPLRSFAKMEADGTVGSDLAIFADRSDSKCLAKYLPTLADPEKESIHQATNSLSLTLCKRAERCEPTAYNTFIVAIVQHKTFYNYHAVYEPYVLLFKNKPPFEIHAVSQKPLWIAGRGRAGFGKLTHDQSEMLFMTSMSWKNHGQRYHGFLDDELFLAFGLEDSRTGAIDVVAEDLLRGMGLCSNV
jgi:hypothetical protein